MSKFQDISNKIRNARLRSTTDRIDRTAFIYMDPREDKLDQFSQCGTCRMFSGSRCSLHGPDVAVDAGDSCGLYSPGEFVEGEEEHIMPSVRADESGLVSAQVRCENCAHFSSTLQKCGLYATLNRTLPETFDLRERVHPKGCCNAWVDRKNR